MLDQLESASASLRGLRPLPDDLSADELAGAMRAAQTLLRLAQALVLDLTSAADRADVATSEGAASTQAWLANTAGVSRGAAARDLRLAHDLETSAPQTRAALPHLSADKARVIASAMSGLPARLAAGQRAAVEADLVAKAQRHSYEDLRRATRRALDVIDRELADRAESTALEAEEQRAHRDSTFWMRPADVDGMVEGGFLVAALEADMLRSLLDAATAPRSSRVEALAAGGPSFKERQGRAFADLLRHLPTDEFGNHGGVAATLVVTVEEATLRGELERAGTTSHDTRVSPRELRRLACDAGILPVVLGAQGQVLDLGRSRRLFTTAQRLALAHRDGGCAFPGCDRPPGWCEAHHLRAWAAGGTTDLADGVLLCARHHRLIHHSAWEVRRGRDCLPEFVPPPHLDPQRVPRRNDRWRPAS